MQDSKTFVRKSPLRDKVHFLCPEIQIKEESLEILQDQIEYITEILIKVTAKRVLDDGRKKIKAIDIENSFKDFMENKEALDEIRKKLLNTIKELDNIRDNSLVSFLEV